MPAVSERKFLCIAAIIEQITMRTEKKTNNHLSGSYDPKKYGNWRYMENTRGHVTCREERERLSGGKSESYWDYKNIPHQLTVCNEPKYWCRDGACSKYGGDIYS